MENKINIDLLCPVCRTLIDRKYLTCENNHVYGFDENVFVLLDAAQKAYIDTFTNRLHEIRKREKFHHIKPDDYCTLPFTDNKEFKNEWRLRRFSLKILKTLLEGRKIKTVLEIGPYNGWLSNRLAGMGFDVTAIDYFADDLDGLKAARYYKNKWSCVQMDLRDISPVKSKFDLVVINHALQFFNNYRETIERSKEILGNGGLLILLGLPFFHNPDEKITAIKENAKYYKDKYGFQIELYPDTFKGFLDLNDYAVIKETGVILKKYPQLLLQNIKALLTSKKAVYFYGTYFKENVILF